MATSRRKKSPLKARHRNSRFQDVSDLLSVGILVGAVLAILIAGAAFKIDDPAPADDATPSQAESDYEVIDVDPSLPAEAEPVAQLSPAPDVVAMEQRDVVQRSISDVDRLIASSGGWTLQFMTTRLTESAETIMQQLGDQHRLYILPHRIDGEPHYRICWGNFSSRADAVATTEIPAVLRALTSEPIPRNIGDLLR
jgi:septal ring-binding cell division protein DamX